MSWNTEREKKLKELWTKGHSGSKIARILGNGATRNSVLGKAFRLKLESRAPSKKSAFKPSAGKETSAEVKPQKLGRKAKFKALLLDKDFEAENPKKLEELTNETCKWPNGHPYEEKFYFCGRKSLEKFPYCRLHVLYAFQPKNAKEEDQITDEDMPKFIEKKIKSA